MTKVKKNWQCQVTRYHKISSNSDLYTEKTVEEEGFPRHRMIKENQELYYNTNKEDQFQQSTHLYIDSDESDGEGELFITRR